MKILVDLNDVKLKKEKTIGLRIDQITERMLEEMAEIGMSKSEVIRRGVQLQYEALKGGVINGL